jgi:hypothetical protein
MIIIKTGVCLSLYYKKLIKCYDETQDKAQKSTKLSETVIK